MVHTDRQEVHQQGEDTAQAEAHQQVVSIVQEALLLEAALVEEQVDTSSAAQCPSLPGQ